MPGSATATAGGITLYEILGVMPGASLDEIRDACAERRDALSPARLSGAPSKVVSAASLALRSVDAAWQVLADRPARQRYDEAAGIRRPGTGLVPAGQVPSEPGWDPDLTGNPLVDAGFAGVFTALEIADELAGWLAPHPHAARRVTVPDIRGLFYRPCSELIGRAGLQLVVVRLTAHPAPVEGLVVGQSPAAGRKARRGSMLTAEVWHPPEPGR
ncbi:MAG: PASTA domain-containing protein [Actinobacteria bacterium]|nr:PASTA domain-containing protein [Actinomycetota bacterium]